MAKQLLFPILTLLSFSLLQGQAVDIGKLKGLSIRNIGPSGMSGRVTAIDAVIDNPDIIYAGTASGGVWKSASGGISWTPVFDEQPTQSIGAIAINQRTPDVIWVGTGEGNPRNSQNSGQGIFRSLDGGKTWRCMGLENTRTIHRILLHPDNQNIVFAAAMGSAWGPNPERGVYRSTDGGKSWQRVLYINDSTGCADLVIDPTNPNKLIAAMWEYGRKPWTFNSGGPGSGIYVTLDGGESWEKRGPKEGLPEGALGRTGLAIARSKPNIVYALVEAQKNALYKSTDGGRSFQMINDKEGVSDRPFYYHEIYVDPQNENRIFSLYSSIARSEDGGRSFEVIRSSGGVHPDHHALWISPDNPNLIMNGNDGGFYLTRDGGESWQFAEGLPVGQFYHVNYDMEVPYNIGGGLQDNGSFVGPAYKWAQGGIRNADWQEVFFGDGFDVSFRPGDSRYVYAMSQGGNLGQVDRFTGKSRFIRPVAPDGAELRFNWNAAFAQSPSAPCRIYYGSQFLHKSEDCGDSWTIISPDLTTNDTTKQRQNISGGLTIDNTAAENHTTILAIAPSSIDENIIWVGTDDGNLQLTRDGGQSWTNLAAKLPGVKAGSWIPYIEVSKINRGEAFVVVNDYRRNDWRPMVFHTTDFGQSWRNIVAGSKVVTGPALSVIQDKEAPNLFFLGTDNGLFFSIDGAQTWAKWTEGFPSVPVTDLKIHPREHDLIIATFGRAFWVLDDIRPLRALAKTQGKVLDSPFAAFDAPDAYLAEFRSYEGFHFPGNAIFSGENRAPGARITVWVNPKEEGSAEKKAVEKEAAPTAGDSKGKKKADPAKATAEPAAKPAATAAKPADKPKRPERIKIQVVDSKGDTIRTFSPRADTGMVRLVWNLRRDGVRFPSRRTERPDADPPAGPTVAPGAYKLILSYGKLKDSTSVTVLADPRLPVNPADIEAREAAYRELTDVIKKATQAFDRLQEARKTIRLVDDALVNAPDSTKQAISKKGKDLVRKIDEMEKLFMMPEGLKGIQRSSNNLGSTLQSAGRYVNDSQGGAGSSARILMDKARRETTAVLEKVNEFIGGDFSAYQKRVEAVTYSLFKKYEAIK